MGEKTQSTAAVELRESFDFCQDSRVCKFAINLALLCNPFFLFPCVEDLTFPVSGFLHLLEVRRVSEEYGDLHSPDTTLVEGTTTDLCCVPPGGARLRAEVQWQAARPAQRLLQNHPLASVAPSQGDHTGPRSDAISCFPTC